MFKPNLMLPKCHLLRVTWHLPSNQIHFNYSLHQQSLTLEQVQPAKYLGITITYNLVWGQHVSEISSTAIKTFFLGAIWHLHLGIRRNTLVNINALAKARTYRLRQFQRYG